jgi:hypothetical protein
VGEDLGDGQSEWRAYPSREGRYVRTRHDLDILLGWYSNRFAERPDPNEQSTK